MGRWENCAQNCAELRAVYSSIIEYVRLGEPHDAIVFETSSMSCANGGASSDKSFSILLLIRLRR